MPMNSEKCFLKRGKENEPLLTTWMPSIFRSLHSNCLGSHRLRSRSLSIGRITGVEHPQQCRPALLAPIELGAPAQTFGRRFLRDLGRLNNKLGIASHRRELRCA